MIFWITGRKGSGKTTLSKRIAKQLNAIIIDGDDIRNIICNDFSYEGRKSNQEIITNLALLFSNQGFNVVIACVSPFLKLRKELQERLPGCIEIELPFGDLWKDTEYEETK